MNQFYSRIFFFFSEREKIHFNPNLIVSTDFIFFKSFDLMQLAACANIAQATRVRAPQNLRPLAGDRVRLD